MTRRHLLLTHLILIGFSIWSVLPVLWTLLSSFKPQGKIFSTKIELVADPTLDNYTALLGRADFIRWAGNSLLVSILTTVLGVFLAATCAYAISRFRFRGRRPALYLFLVAQMFPGIILLIPLYQTFTTLHLIDTPWALVLSYSTIAVPFCVLMLKGFFDTIPYELEEAGRVDGLGVFGTFWRIVVPLSIPGLAVTAFYSFITAWNEFLFARSFLTSKEALTLPVGMATFIDPFNQPWNLLTAGSVLITIPVMVFFYVAQRYLISGLATGGVKG
ncbi:MAG TPA: carbohydrate ABC transporter permease [Candidatus Limnocylindrales bacterium]